MLAGPSLSFKAGALPPTMQQPSQPSSRMYPNPNQFQPPVLPPNFQGNSRYQPQTQFPTQPPVLPPGVSGDQQQFHSQPPMMTNGMSMLSKNLHFKKIYKYLSILGQSPVQHPYLNSGVPPSSTQIQSTSITPQQFDVPPTIAHSNFQNLQPTLPNQFLPNMNDASPYQRSQYPGGQSTYNGLPSSFPAGNQPPLSTDYPSQSYRPNLPGPPSMPGNQLNGPNSYPGQPPSNGLVQKPFPQSRIDPDMVPNVVRKLFLEIQNIVLFIIILI
jgi:hypothetical protein